MFLDPSPDVAPLLFLGGTSTANCCKASLLLLYGHNNIIVVCEVPVVQVQHHKNEAVETETKPAYMTEFNNHIYNSSNAL